MYHTICVANIPWYEFVSYWIWTPFHNLQFQPSMGCKGTFTGNELPTKVWAEGPVYILHRTAPFGKQATVGRGAAVRRHKLHLRAYILPDKGHAYSKFYVMVGEKWTYERNLSSPLPTLEDKGSHGYLYRCLVWHKSNISRVPAALCRQHLLKSGIRLPD
jgi:hypothetical protein